MRTEESFRCLFGQSEVIGDVLQALPGPKPIEYVGYAGTSQLYYRIAERNGWIHDDPNSLEVR